MIGGHLEKFPLLTRIAACLDFFYLKEIVGGEVFHYSFYLFTFFESQARGSKLGSP